VNRSTRSAVIERRDRAHRCIKSSSYQGPRVICSSEREFGPRRSSPGRRTVNYSGECSFGKPLARRDRQMALQARDERLYSKPAVCTSLSYSGGETAPLKGSDHGR
jgi:hypothetical protein